MKSIVIRSIFIVMAVASILHYWFWAFQKISDRKPSEYTQLIRYFENISHQAELPDDMGLLIKEKGELISPTPLQRMTAQFALSPLKVYPYFQDTNLIINDHTNYSKLEEDNVIWKSKEGDYLLIRKP